MNSGSRVRILCEDRRTERFLRGLCDRFGIRVLADVEVAPNGRGSASDWVLARYALAVRKLRSKNFQRGLGLLVHVDGDHHGVQARMNDLATKLSTHDPSVAARGANEPIAIFIPTWCTETWLLHLAAIAQPPESAKLKRDPDPTFRGALRSLEDDEAGAIRRAVGTWPRCSLPSVQQACTEARRIGIA